MSMRTLILGLLTGLGFALMSSPVLAQSALIKALDVKGTGKVSRDDLPEGPKRRIFDSVMEKGKLDPAKTYTLQELDEANGTAGSGGSRPSSGTSGSNGSRPSGGPSKYSDSRKSYGRGSGGGGSSGSSIRSSRSPSDGRPFRALEELPEKYRALDKDGDGQIAMHEWPRDNIAEFLRLDKNDDGFLTIDELRNGPPSSSDKDRDKAKKPEKKPPPDEGADPPKEPDTQEN